MRIPRTIAQAVPRDFLAFDFKALARLIRVYKPA
jgi:hypothetical protein